MSLFILHIKTSDNDQPNSKILTLISHVSMRILFLFFTKTSMMI